MTQVNRNYKYVAYIFIALTIILFIVLIGKSRPSEKQSSTSDYSQSIKTETKTITETITKYQCSDGSIKEDINDCPSLKNIKNFSGNSDTVTESFYLNQGLAIIQLAYSGDSNFIVYLIDTYGNTDLIANEIGYYTGIKSVTINRAGSYRISVEVGTSYSGSGFSSTASWIINIEQ